MCPMRALSVRTLGFDIVLRATLEALEDPTLAILWVLPDAVSHAFARCHSVAAVLAHIGLKLAVFDVWSTKI